MKSNPFFLLENSESSEEDKNQKKVQAMKIGGNEYVASVEGVDVDTDEGNWNQKTKKKSQGTGRGGNQRGGPAKGKKKKQRLANYVVINLKNIVMKLHDEIAKSRNMNGYETTWINLWRKDFIWQLCFPNLQKNQFFVIGRDGNYKTVDYIAIVESALGEDAADVKEFQQMFGVHDCNIFKARLFIPRYDFVNDPDVHKILQSAWRANIPEEFKIDGAIMYNSSISPFVIEDGKILVFVGLSVHSKALEASTGRFDFNKDASLDESALRKFEEDTSIVLETDLRGEKVFHWDFTKYNMIWRNFYVQLDSREALPIEQIQEHSSIPRKDRDRSDFQWIEFDALVEQSPGFVTENFEHVDEDLNHSNIQLLREFFDKRIAKSNE